MNIKMTLTFWLVGVAFSLMGALVMYMMAQNFLIERYLLIQRTIIVNAWQAAVPADEFPTQDELISIGHRVVRNEMAAGGALFNEIGMKQASFGLEPSLGYEAVRLDPEADRWSPTGQYYDFSLPQALLGTKSYIIIRVAAAPLVQQARSEARKLASALISVGTGVAGLLGLFFFLRFAQPVSQIARAVAAGVNDPANGDVQRLNWGKRDLVGELANATDHLLTTIAVLHQEELTVTQRAIDAMPFAVLQFDQHGVACNANAKALAFFRLDSLAELTSLDPKFIQDRNSRQLRALSVVELLRGVSSTTSVTPLYTEGRTKNCLITASTILSTSGEFIRYVMLIVDLEEHGLRTEQQVTNAEQEIELRRLFATTELIKCCDLALQSQLPQDEDGRYDCADIAADWFALAQRHHMVGSNIETGVIPLLIGDEDTVRSAIECGLLLCTLRAVSDRPSFSLTAYTRGSETSDNVRHTEIAIREQLDPEARPAVWVHGEDQRWKMVVAALTRLLPALNGKGLEYKQTKSGAVVEFSLPCDTSSRKKTSFELEAESA